MSYEEMLSICSLLVRMGIEKIRITGGEPFVRKDIMQFLTALSKLQGLQELTITTNGVLTEPHIPELKAMGVKTINLSLDTLDAARFFAITGRDEFAKVMSTMDALLAHGMNVKINAVVMEGKNTMDIGPLVELKLAFPGIVKLPDPPYSTSYNYAIPGHKGTVGIIAAYSRTFCGTCNRARITPVGELKTCLYDEGVLNLKDMMRDGKSENELEEALLKAFGTRAKDGWEAENLRNNDEKVHESMATIGG